MPWPGGMGCSRIQLDVVGHDPQPCIVLTRHTLSLRTPHGRRAGFTRREWSSRALAVIAAVYTGTALLASLYDIENVLFQLGWNPTGTDWSLTSLPNVLLPALVLLAAGAGAFAVQRRHRATA